MNRNGESKQISLSYFWSEGKNIQFYAINYDSSCRWFIDAFYHIEIVF